jgi:two-component system nitrate/nitrite response regulator NarL
MRSGSPIRVLVADDHPIFRAGLCKLLETDPDFRVIGEAGDGSAALALVRSLCPDVLLLDVAMPGMTGLEVLRELALDARGPRGVRGPRTILLTASIDPTDIIAALRLGSAGVLLKTAATELLFKCLRAVLAGEYWVGRETVASLVDALPTRKNAPVGSGGRPFGLTARELEVLSLVATGASNKIIALELGLSEETVKHHVSKIFDKTGQSTRVELALFAVHSSLIDAK